MNILSDPNFSFYLVAINIGVYFITQNKLQLYVAGFCGVMGVIANITS